jgi:hypothetical protein
MTTPEPRALRDTALFAHRGPPRFRLDAAALGLALPGPSPDATGMEV